MEKNKVEGIRQAHFKTAYKATVIEPIWHCHGTDIKTNGNRTFEINPYVHGQSTDFQQRKNSLSTDCAGKTEYPLSKNIWTLSSHHIQ